MGNTRAGAEKTLRHFCEPSARWGRAISDYSPPGGQHPEEQLPPEEAGFVSMEKSVWKLPGWAFG